MLEGFADERAAVAYIAVPRRVAHGVVDGLEVIEVKDRHGEGRGFVFLDAGIPLHFRLHKDALALDAGQPVAAGKLGGLLQGPGLGLLAADVLVDVSQAEDDVRIVPVRHAAGLHVDIGGHAVHQVAVIHGIAAVFPQQLQQMLLVEQLSHLLAALLADVCEDALTAGVEEIFTPLLQIQLHVGFGGPVLDIAVGFGVDVEDEEIVRRERLRHRRAHHGRLPALHLGVDVAGADDDVAVVQARGLHHDVLRPALHEHAVSNGEAAVVVHLMQDVFFCKNLQEAGHILGAGKARDIAAAEIEEVLALLFDADLVEIVPGPVLDEVVRLHIHIVDDEVVLGQGLGNAREGGQVLLLGKGALFPGDLGVHIAHAHDDVAEALPLLGGDDLHAVPAAHAVDHEAVVHGKALALPQRPQQRGLVQRVCHALPVLPPDRLLDILLALGEEAAAAGFDGQQAVSPVGDELQEAVGLDVHVVNTLDIAGQGLGKTGKIRYDAARQRRLETGGPVPPLDQKALELPGGDGL